ncbi:cytoskeleton-associated protein 2 isoform X2 [Xenopus laevis]|uniref:Cytoskeleton-associated protein 2 isoform X2 n=1 Tax=Xenopus laevis TaxID=8355 RepID=A0A8J0UH27_XENLA|nr:cytoskeleton-associated protein 2 isoform X2 [Xenopus laevis]
MSVCLHGGWGGGCAFFKLKENTYSIRRQGAAMAGLVKPLAASKRQQPQYREQRRKKVEEYLSKKMATPNHDNLVGPAEDRSPLTERQTLMNLKNKTENLKPAEHKQTGKENVSVPSVKNKDNALHVKNPFKDARSKIDTGIKKVNSDSAVSTDPRKGQSLSKTFLKNKNVKERELKSETSSKPAANVPLQKPVLGAYRGKVIQSKINSFRKTPLNTDDTNFKGVMKPVSTAPHNAGARPKTINVSTKHVVKSAYANTIVKKPPTTAQSRTQVRASTSAVNQKKTEPYTARRHTSAVLSRNPTNKALPTRPTADKTINSGSLGHKAAVQNKGKTLTSSVKPLPGPQQNRPAKQPMTVPSTRQTKTAEEQKACLAKWREEKGKVMKRPPISTFKSSTYKVQKEVVCCKSEPEPPRKVAAEIKSESKKSIEEPPRKLFWETMAEEDEQELFTLKVDKIFADCQKLIDEGCPKEEVLDILEKQIQNIPEAKKLSKYWECLALLEKRQGELAKVIVICEEAVAAGAQPLDDLRTILADAVESLKAESEGCTVEDCTEEPAKEEAVVAEIKSENEQSELEVARVKSERKVKQRGARHVAIKEETRPSDMEEELPNNHPTPQKTESSTVIRFNVRSTPHLQKIKTKMQLDDGDSTIKDLKFLTPVRRSSRLERKSLCLPGMLRDHDPCVSGISQLEDLENCPSAYIFRRNNALQDIEHV